MKKRTASKKSQEGMRVAALFAGVGGIEKGFHAAGHSTALFCEVDAAACAVLEDRFPGVPIHRDITTLKDVGKVDVLTGGFPCQDLSQAGQTKGLAGTKSSLVEHVFRLLDRRSIPWVVLENVPFMLQLAKGHALDFIVTEFEKRGYRWAYRVIDSLAFGVPQRRERVYFVASLVGDPRSVVFSGNEPPPVRDALPPGTAFGFYWTEGSRGLGWAVDAVPTLKGGSTIGIASPPAIWLPDGRIVQPDIRDAERLQGFDADWTKPAESVARSSYRWRLVGNAVTVPVAAWLGEQLSKPEGDYVLPGNPVIAGRSWPRAAWNVGDGRFFAVVSSWPVHRTRPPLAAFLQFPPRLLSERATAGFLARFEASQLSKPTGFIEALRDHLRGVQRSGKEAHRHAFAEQGAGAQ